MALIHKVPGKVRAAIRKVGVRVSWVRRVLDIDSDLGEATETSRTTYVLLAGPGDADSTALASGDVSQLRRMQLILAADGLPFDPVAPATEPDVRFEDLVDVRGVEFRVVKVERLMAPDPGSDPILVAYQVWLEA